MELQESHGPNVRSPAYYVASARVPCRFCRSSTLVLALALPPNHEVLEDDGETAAWQAVPANAFLFYVTALANSVEVQLSQLSAHCFYFAHSDTTQNSYWANHCEHCGQLLADHELHCEPEGPFSPTEEAEAARISLATINEAFEGAAAGYALDPEFFRFMRKI
jgi:hypothetical protein